MRGTFATLSGVFLLGGVAFLFLKPHEVRIASVPLPQKSASSSAEVVGIKANPVVVAATTTPMPSGDIGPQPQLSNPPEVVKAIYLTGWSAGSKKKIQEVLGLLDRTELNAVVIDIKDYSGYVSYAMNVPEVKAAGAEKELRIAEPNILLKALHEKNIYVIGRITVFQDPIFAKAHPEFALHQKATGELWKDNKRLPWMDPAGKGTWEYVTAIAKDAIARGFDEINFDYVRFASDGTLSEISYPFWDQKTARHTVIGSFFKYLRGELGEARLSADLFGLATINKDDLGIGQVIEDAYKYFDYVSPMIYPSHYASGFIGYKNPAVYPYEVMHYSLMHALVRLEPKPTVALATSTLTASASVAVTNSTSSAQIAFRAKLRPWIQDFDLGAKYTPEMVKKELQSVSDVLKGDQFAGWMMWNPSNIYTEAALTKNGE